MKFVLVGPASPLRGGIAQYTDSLASALSVEHEVRTVSFRNLYPKWLFPGRTQYDREASPDSSSIHILDATGRKSWKRAAKEILSFEPDLVLFQWWHPFLTPCYGGVLKSIQDSDAVRVFLCHNVLSHEGSSIPGRSWVERSLVRRLFRKVDGFLVQADDLRREITALVPKRPVRKILHPSYDFYLEWDDAKPVEKEKTRLLFFGLVRRYKGLETLIEAIARLPEGFDFELVVAGEFYVDSGPIQRLAERTGVSDRIVWLDRYIPNSEIPALFRSADVVVLPYLRASQSGVVPLAYQFEVPVIASRVGGLSEVVLNGETGFLVPPGDPDRLAAAISEYFSKGRKPVFQKRIAEFRRHLSWDQVVDNILLLHRDVEAAQRRGGRSRAS